MAAISLLSCACFNAARARAAGTRDTAECSLYNFSQPRAGRLSVINVKAVVFYSASRQKNAIARFGSTCGYRVALIARPRKREKESEAGRDAFAKRDD